MGCRLAIHILINRFTLKPPTPKRPLPWQQSLSDSPQRTRLRWIPNIFCFTQTGAALHFEARLWGMPSKRCSNHRFASVALHCNRYSVSITAITRPAGHAGVTPRAICANHRVIMKLTCTSLSSWPERD